MDLPAATTPSPKPSLPFLKINLGMSQGLVLSEAKDKTLIYLAQKENQNFLSLDLWMRSGNTKIFAVNLQNSVLKGRVWSCSGKFSSVTREALISDIDRVSAKCTCSAWTNYIRVEIIPSSSFAPAQMQPLCPPEPAALTRPRSLFLHVAAEQLQPSVHPNFCLLQPHCLFPQRPLHEHCQGGKGDPMARMLLECSRSCQLWHLKDRDTSKLPLVTFRCHFTAFCYISE